MTYRTLAASLTLTALLASAASPALAADWACPLREEKYIPIRDAAMALEKAVNSNPKCEAERQALYASAKNILDAASQVGTNPENYTINVNGYVTPQEQAAATVAMNSFGNLSDALDHLSPECRNTPNEAGIFIRLVDSINRLAPYIAIVSGPQAAPYVLGGTILLTAIKALHHALFARKYDMTDLGTRKAFIDNVCAFYRLRNTIQLINSDKRGKKDQVKDELIVLNKRIADLVAIEPPKGHAEGSFEAQREQLAKERADLAEFERGWSIPDMDYKIEIFRQYYDFDHRVQKVAGLVNGLIEGKPSNGPNYDKILAKTFVSKSSPERFDPVKLPPPACQQNAQDWLNLYKSFLSRTEELLTRYAGTATAPSGAETEAREKRKQWEADFAALKTQALNKQADLTVLEGMNSPGGNIEKSDIDFAKQKIGHELFSEDYRPGEHRRNPSLAWITVQRDFSRQSIKDFNERLDKALKIAAPALAEKNVQKLVNEIQPKVSPLACPLLRSANENWAEGENAYLAYRDFCVAFNQNADTAEHRYVAANCRERAMNGEKANVYKRKAQLDYAIKVVMPKLGCRTN